MAMRPIGKIASTYGDRNIPLRRPHESKVVKKITPQALILKLSSINCDNSEDDSLDKAIEMFESLSPTEDDAVTVIRHLHAACLMDRTVIRPMAVFLAKLIKHKAEGGHFIRTQWLLLLQEDFEGRKTLSTSSHETFLNAVSSHGEVYNSLLVASVPLKVLAPPLIQYLKMILSIGSKDDLEVLLIQLVANGKNLISQGGDEYTELLVEIRKILLNSGSLQLVLATDITAGYFPHPHGPLRDFYVSELKDEYLALEARALGVTFNPIANGLSPVVHLTQDLPDKLTVSNDGSRPKPVTSPLPDVTNVRERMRAKGLLPRHPATAKQPENDGVAKEKDDEFYGLQLPRGKTSDTKNKGMRQAMSVPLPTNDDWD